LRKVAVIYDSKFGNTEKVAKALSEGLKREGVEVDSMEVDSVNPNGLTKMRADDISFNISAN